MRNDLEHDFHLNSEGNPAGGATLGNGLHVTWQRGPVVPGNPNGCFVEDLLEAAKARLNWFQASKFACEANAAAIDAIDFALSQLDRRTADRKARGVEGTYTP